MTHHAPVRQLARARVQERAVMARTPGRSGPIGIIVMVVGIIFAAAAGAVAGAGVATYVLVATSSPPRTSSPRTTRNTSPASPSTHRGRRTPRRDDQQARPQGHQQQTYAEPAPDDPTRETAIQASFLRASLFTSLVAFGVAALAAVLGITLFLIGLSLRGLGRPPALGAAGPGY